MRIILRCDKEMRIVDRFKALDWLCIKLLIKSRIFIRLHEMRKGLVNVRDKGLKELLMRREGKRVELKYCKHSEVDKIMFYKGMRDFILVA